MTRSIRPRLQDILDNIDLATGATAGRDLDAFTGNPILRLAVERAIEIISEAVRHIPKEIRDDYPGVPWRNILAVGNKLRHEYHRIDADIIWDIARTHLPALKPVIEEMCRRIP